MERERTTYKWISQTWCCIKEVWHRRLHTLCFNRMFNIRPGQSMVVGQHSGGLGWEGPGLMKMFSDLIWGLLIWLNTNVNTYQCDKLHQLWDEPPKMVFKKIHYQIIAVKSLKKENCGEEILSLSQIIGGNYKLGCI